MEFQKIQSLKELIKDVQLFDMTSLFLAVFGIILAYYFYLKSIRHKAPTYAVRSVNLVEDSVGKIDDIEINYLGSRVKCLSIARVALWNFGKETISSQDVAPLCPIKIVGSNSTVFLGAEIVYEKNSANNFSLLPIIDTEIPLKHLQNELKINFDYFDQFEGIIIQIFHTGKTGDDIQIEGVIKGAGPVKRISKSIFARLPSLSIYFEKMKRRHQKIFVASLLIITPFVVLISEFIPNSEAQNSVLIVKFVSLAIVSIVYWSLAFSILRSRIPKGFDMFEEELKP